MLPAGAIIESLAHKNFHSSSRSGGFSKCEVSSLNEEATGGRKNIQLFRKGGRRFAWNIQAN